MFDLFELHKKEEDIFPGSWICFEGDNINKIIKNVIYEILFKSKTHSYYSISQEISKKEGLCVSAVFEYLKNKRKDVPIPVILSLLNIWKSVLNKNDNEIKMIKEKILETIGRIKINNSTSKSVLVTKELDEDICYILGVHAADGMLSVHFTFSSRRDTELNRFKNLLNKKFKKLKLTKGYFDIHKKYYNFGVTVNKFSCDSLSTFLFNSDFIKNKIIEIKREYKWKFSEEHRDSLYHLSILIKNYFGVNLSLKKGQGNWWNLETKNKILVRYLSEFFGFPYGKKSRIVDEPSILKNSDLALRQAFFRGIMTFDGSVNKDGSLSFQCYSKCLVGSFNDVLKLSGIKLNVGKTQRGSYFINSLKSDKGLIKWLTFIDIDTLKGRKLKGFIFGFDKKVNSENEALENLGSIFDLTNTKINIKENFKIMKRLNKFRIKDYCRFVNNNYDKIVTRTLAKANIDLFERCNILKVKKKKVFFMRTSGNCKGTKGAVIENLFNFNPKIEEWRVP